MELKIIKNDKTLNDVTFNRIREDIMNMNLEPGTEVSVQKLSERYGVSRTPAREAVVRLQQTGLLEVYPQRKTVVSKIDLKRVREEWFIRNSLESAVVDEFIHNCSPLVVDTMEEIIKKQKKYTAKEDFRDFYIRDNRFHQLVFEVAGEELAWATIEAVTSHYNRIRLLHMKLYGVEPSVLKEHGQMVDAARNLDVEAMRKVVNEHSLNLLDYVKNMPKQYPHFFI